MEDKRRQSGYFEERRLLAPGRVLRAGLDVLAAIVAWYGAGVAIFSLGAGNGWWALPASLAVWPLVLLFFGVYSQQRLRPVKLGFILLVQALAVYLGLLAAMMFFLRLPVDRTQYLYFAAVLTPFSLAIQGLYSYRRFVTVVNGRGGVLIVGAGRYGRELARRLRQRPELGLEVIGFLDDGPETAGQICGGAGVLGRCRELDLVLGDRRITEVVLALPDGDLDLIEELVEICRESGVPVSLVGMTGTQRRPGQPLLAWARRNSSGRK